MQKHYILNLTMFIHQIFIKMEDSNMLMWRKKIERETMVILSRLRK